MATAYAKLSLSHNIGYVYKNDVLLYLHGHSDKQMPNLTSLTIPDGGTKNSDNI